MRTKVFLSFEAMIPETTRVRRRDDCRLLLRKADFARSGAGTVVALREPDEIGDP